MSELILADVAEFQGLIDWPNYGSSAVIVRLCYGDVKIDAQADRNIDGARSRCQVRGWYCYLITGRDPVAQADTFCKILQAHGGLFPNEFIVVDDEESNGADEVARVNAFLSRCDVLLKTSPNQDWWYSGLYFAIAHNLAAAKGRRWVAAYMTNEPTYTHDLWQETSTGSISGIQGNVDLSIFHGSIKDLIALIGGSQSTSLTGGTMSAVPVPYGNGTDRIDAFIINPDDRLLYRLFTMGGAGGLDQLSHDAKQWWAVGTAPKGGFEPNTLTCFLDSRGRWVIWAINRIAPDRGQTYELVLRLDGVADQDWSPVCPPVALPFIGGGSYDDTQVKNRLNVLEAIVARIKAAIG